MFPKSGAHMEWDAHSRALLNISFGAPSKGALPPGPPRGVPMERDAPFLQPSLWGFTGTLTVHVSLFENSLSNFSCSSF
jgi:hypothetical protein